MKAYKRPRALIITALALALFTAACKGPEVTEKQVAEILEKMEAAAKVRDFNRICSFMSEKVQIKHILEGGGQSANKTFTREEYRKQANEFSKYAEGYEYACKNRKIMITQDRQGAHAVEEIHETLSIGGNSFRAVSIGSTTFGLEDGQLVVTAIESRGQVEMASAGRVR